MYDLIRCIIMGEFLAVVIVLVEILKIFKKNSCTLFYWDHQVQVKALRLKI